MSRFFLIACGKSKAPDQQVGQQNAGKSATKALSSYFGNWLASQYPKVTWPLGLGFFDKSGNNFKMAPTYLLLWHLLAMQTANE